MPVMQKETNNKGLYFLLDKLNQEFWVLLMLLTVTHGNLLLLQL